MTSHPEYGKDTTATEAALALGDCIRGRTVVITGVSPVSIGYTTALATASQAPGLLILASRTRSKLDSVVADIASKYPATTAKTVLLDLSSVASVRSAAEAIARLTDRVDVLINNAGISTPLRQPLETPSGTVVDLQFYTNHLGVFLLTDLLLPLLRTAAAAAGQRPRGATRAVNVSSQGHGLSPVRYSDLAFQKGLYDVPGDEQPQRALPPFFATTVDGFPGFLGYGQSKTANILHASELSRRLRRAHENVVALSVHPGTIETELSRSLDKDGRETISKTAPHGLWKTQDQGASTTIVAAFDPLLGTADIGGSTVGYLSDCQLRDDMVASHASGAAAGKRLWEESARLLGLSTSL